MILLEDNIIIIIMEKLNSIVISDYSKLKKLKDIYSNFISKINITFDIINGASLSENQITQIKNVYSSNSETKSWWQVGRMKKKDYTFSVIKANNIIIGVAGIDFNDLELRDDAVHNNYQGKGYYKQLLVHTNKWLLDHHKDKIFYLFTEKTSDESYNQKKILNHLNAGLVLLENTTNKINTYKSIANRKTYQHLGGIDYLIFRTPGSHGLNMITYNYTTNSPRYRSENNKYSTCSGIYIGNGIIITADHCDKEKAEDVIAHEDRNLYTIKNVDVNFVNMKKSTNKLNFHPNYKRTNLNGLEFNDIAIIKISDDEINNINHDLEIIPLLQDNNYINTLLLNDKHINFKSQMYGRNIGIQNTVLDKINYIQFIDDFFADGAFSQLPKILFSGDKSREGDNIFDKVFKRLKNNLFCSINSNSKPGDSGGPHWLYNNNNQMIYIGPTGTKPYLYCTTPKDSISISPVYNYLDTIKEYKRPILIYNYEQNKFIYM
jgi:hypothetical protein